MLHVSAASPAAAAGGGSFTVPSGEAPLGSDSSSTAAKQLQLPLSNGLPSTRHAGVSAPSPAAGTPGSQLPSTPMPPTPSADDLARQARRVARLVGRTLSVDIHAPLDPQAALLKSIQVVRSEVAVRWGHLPASIFFALPLSEVRPRHVVQGEVLDGAFLAALASLSLKGRLSSLLIPPRAAAPNADPAEEEEEETPDPNIHTFRFHSFDTDTLQIRQPRVSVSALVPVEKSSNLPLAAALTEQVGWVALLEKAYASHIGGYDRLHAGAWPAATMFALTGANASIWELKPFEGTAGRKPAPGFEDAQEMHSRARGTIMLVASKRVPIEPPAASPAPLVGTITPNNGPSSSPAASPAASSPAVPSAASAASSSLSAATAGLTLLPLPFPPSVPSALSSSSSSSPGASAGSALLLLTPSSRPIDHGQCYAVLDVRLAKDSKTEKETELVELWATWPVQQQWMHTLNEGDEEAAAAAAAAHANQSTSNASSAQAGGGDDEEHSPCAVPVPLLPASLAQSWKHWQELHARWDAEIAALESNTNNASSSSSNSNSNGETASTNTSSGSASSSSTLVIPWSVLLDHPEFQQMHYCDL